MKILALLVFGMQAAWAIDPSANMKSIYSDITTVYNHLDEKNCQKSLKHLNQIKEKADKLGKHFFLEADGYRVSYKIFRTNLNELIYACETKTSDPKYRKTLYRGLVQSCFQCHSSDRVTRDGSSLVLKGAAGDRVAHLMVSRNYELAKQEINKYFKKGSKEDLADVLALEQDLYLKYFNDSKSLIKSYEKRKIGKKWDGKLKLWAMTLKSLPKFKKKAELLKAAETAVKTRIGMMADDSEALRIKHMIGRLLTLLHESGGNEAAKVLYFLGSLENRLEHSHYSVDNIYLTECLLSHNKSPYADKCYAEFKDQVELSFTGSAVGTKVPENIQQLLKELNPKSKRPKK